MGDTTPHFATVLTLSTMTKESLSQKANIKKTAKEEISDGREKIKIEHTNGNIKLTFSTEFVFFTCSTSFLQTIVTNKPTEEKKRQKLRNKALLLAILRSRFEHII